MVVPRALTLACLVALLIAVPAAEAAAKRSVPRGFNAVMLDRGGESDPPAAVEAQLDLMARSGVESLRTVFNWAAIQPAANGRFDFSRQDALVRAAAVRRIVVLPVMLYAPVWARARPSSAASPPLTAPYLRFLRAAIARYGSRGSFWRENPQVPRTAIRHWQIANEPHFRIFWDAPPESRYAWPSAYARLLRAAHRTIHRADRNARTVMGGLFGASWTELRRLYRSGRVEGQFDAVAIHVYVQNESRVLETVRRVRREMKRAGDARKRLFITETAFPASLGKAKPIAGQRQETPRGMARRLYRTYLGLARRRREWRLDRVYWYTWSSSYPARGENFDFSGLVARSGPFSQKPEPALDSFRRIAERLQGCAKDARGRCR